VVTLKAFLEEGGMMSDGQIEFLVEALKGDGIKSLEALKEAVGGGGGGEEGGGGGGGRIKEGDLIKKYGLSKGEARELYWRLRDQPPPPQGCCVVL